MAILMSVQPLLVRGAGSGDPVSPGEALPEDGDPQEGKDRDERRLEEEEEWDTHTTLVAHHTHTHTHTHHTVLEPAAHLDPGPEGHDVYGGVGHALTLVSVPLDMRATQQRLEGRSRGAERSLSHCRQLLARYLAGINRDGEQWIMDSPILRLSLSPSLGSPLLTGVGAHPPTSSSPPAVDISPLPSAQLPTVIAAYDAAIVSLLGVKETELAVMAMHELGNVMYHTHNTK